MEVTTVSITIYIYIYSTVQSGAFVVNIQENENCVHNRIHNK